MSSYRVTNQQLLLLFIVGHIGKVYEQLQVMNQQLLLLFIVGHIGKVYEQLQVMNQFIANHMQMFIVGHSGEFMSSYRSRISLL
jgi:hypothetical protein